MSMNIHIEATRDIQVIKTGKVVEQTISFDGQWQTPTDVSYAIARSDDPLAEYSRWVMNRTAPVTFNVYAEDDVFSEREPIGTQTYHPGEMHLSDLGLWIDGCIAEGYEIHWVVL